MKPNHFFGVTVCRRHRRGGIRLLLHSSRCRYVVRWCDVTGTLKGDHDGHRLGFIDLASVVPLSAQFCLGW